jgi:hypothetical protein
VTWRGQVGLRALLSCRCRAGLTYGCHGEVALPSLLVDSVEVAVGLPELPPLLLLFLPPLPPPLPPLWRLFFLFRLLLLLGGQDGTEVCGLGAGGTVLV